MSSLPLSRQKSEILVVATSDICRRRGTCAILFSQCELQCFMFHVLPLFCLHNKIAFDRLVFCLHFVEEVDCNVTYRARMEAYKVVAPKIPQTRDVTTFLPQRLTTMRSLHSTDHPL